MKSDVARVGTGLAIVAGFAATSVFAQRAPAARDFQAEIRVSLQMAKTAAGFEFLGTLARTCLLPQSNGDDTSDTSRATSRTPPLRRRVTPGTQSPLGSLTISTSSAARFIRPGP